MISKNENDIKKLEEISRQIRIAIIKMVAEAKSGHPGGSLSVTDLLVGLYFSRLKHRPDEPQWPDRDRMVLSKGHACPALYACLSYSGYFPPEELMTLRKPGTRLQGHPSRTDGLPGIEVSTGSLGHGLSIGVGMALGLRKNKRQSRVYVVMGDGECDEGSVWEAAMSAGHYKLDNLCGIVDYNELQIDGDVEEVMGLAKLADKWRAFRWEVIEIDGHNTRDVVSAYDRAAKIKGKPTVIVAHTIKGKGVSFMEKAVGWHGKAPNKEQAEAALKELGERKC